MFASDIINTLKSEIVKFSQYENLKNFYKSNPQYGILKEECRRRERKLPFEHLFNFLLYPRVKSTDIELLEFSHLIEKDNVNKSDFSKRRRLIPAGYLKCLHENMIRKLYSSQGLTKLHGHLLLAGDGTTYSMPNTREMKQIYLLGRKTGNGEQALARGVVLKDVLNDVIVASNMESYGKDEIRLLQDELNSLSQEVKKNSPVIVLDRKFCAYTMLVPLIEKGFGFVIRVKSGFNADVDEFINSGEKQKTIVLYPAATTVKKLRKLYGKNVDCHFSLTLVRLSPNVVVMTSITEPSLLNDMANIYHFRWDAESTIGFTKNDLQIEIFSSSMDNSIRQDFYARIIQYDLISLLSHQAAELRHGDSHRKINRNIALGIFKLEFDLFFRTDRRHFNRHLRTVLTEMARFTIEIKPGRQNPRNFRNIKQSGKYITLANYREVI